MATVHDHRWTEPDAPRWEGMPDYGRLPDAFASVTALSSYGSSRLLHGVSPAAPLQSHGAEDAA